MRNASQQAAQIFGLAGAIVIAVTLLLIYQLSDAASRSISFNFTVAFIVFQEVTLFATLAINSLNLASNSQNLPLRTAYVSSILFYNSIALITVIIFSFVPFLQSVKPSTYYSVCLAETGLTTALIAILRLIDVSHQSAHNTSEQALYQVELMLHACDRITTLNQIHQWNLASLIQQLCERIRYSEGLRRNQELATQMLSLLDQLESLIKSDSKNESELEATQLTNTLLAIAGRRS